MRVRLFALSLAGLTGAVSAAEPGLKIVTRETFPALTIEQTLYVQSDRSRVESVAGPRTAHITRCDLNKYMAVAYGERTYMSGPLRVHAGAMQRFEASAAVSRTPHPETPNLVIETTTVDTRERKTVFGYTARRVVTTEKRIPLSPAGGEKSEIETDGWYIDLETRPSCEREDEAAGRFVLLGSVMPGDGRPAQFPVVTFKDIGAREGGFAIDVKTTSRSVSPAGDGRDRSFVTRKLVTQLSRETLDPALFEVPAGFRSADGPFAALTEQLRRATESVKQLVASLFR